MAIAAGVALAPGCAILPPPPTLRRVGLRWWRGTRGTVVMLQFLHALFIPTVTATPTQAPTDVPPCMVKTLHASTSQTCVTNFDGRLRCWGENNKQFQGQCKLGIGDTSNHGNTAGSMGRHLPYIDARATNGAPGVAQFSVGGQGGCFVSTPPLNETKCWGQGAHGYNGGQSNGDIGCSPVNMGVALAPLPVPQGCTVLQVMPAESHSCLLCSDRISVYCWGYGFAGALGGSSATRGGTTNWGSSWPATE
eukprot:Hpha_TRINITY_DN16463_c4_g1::TRINITY_DN16463_c4_g1_i1::g.162564::m.162564